jgi:hypothetical protein
MSVRNVRPARTSRHRAGVLHSLHQVEVRLVPDPSDDVETAVVVALARAGVAIDDQPKAYTSAWRAAGLAEFAERMPQSQR